MWYVYTFMCPPLKCKGRERREPCLSQSTSASPLSRTVGATQASIEGFPGGSVVKNPPAEAGDMDSVPGLGGSLEKEMATHCSILAWKIPWAMEPGGL